jgi:thioredoxin 1
MQALRTSDGGPQRVIEVTVANFESVVTSSEGVPILLDFTATWCGPCRVLKPILQKLADESGGRYRVATVDGDEHPALTKRFGVRGYPTLLVLVEGEEVLRHMGLTSKENLAALLRSATNGS